MSSKKNKLAKEKTDKLKTVRANLAEKSLNSYIEESFLPVERGKGYKIRVNALNGIFISSEFNWGMLLQKLGNQYKPDKNKTREDIEKKLGLENVFPPKKIERNFTGQTGSESFCKVDIRFKPWLLSKAEATDHLQTVREQANETEEWAKPLMEWLEDQKLSGFYYVVEFDIWCEFDFTKYYDTRLRVQTLNQLNEKAMEQLDEEAIDLAEWAIDYVTKELVFDDLCKAINVASKAFLLLSGTKLPILIYTPLKLGLIIKINNEMKEVKINLAKAIKVKATVKNYEIEREFKVDKKLKVVLEPGYLKEKEKPITFDKAEWKEGEDENGKFKFIDSDEVQVQPDISKITKNEDDLVEFPVIFSLVKSVGSGEKVSQDKVLKKRDIQLCKTQIYFRLDPLKLRFSVTRPWLPRKGEQFNVDFCVGFENHDDLSNVIPVKVVCYLGDDFKAVKQKTENEKEISEDLIIGNKPEPATFPLIAKRASFWGYFNTAYFEFFIGESSKAAEYWRMNLTALPNMFDTIVAGATAFLGSLHLAYPEFFPAITEQVNIANLEIIPATIYLSYRLLTWSKSTSK